MSSTYELGKKEFHKHFITKYVFLHGMYKFRYWDLGVIHNER